MTASRIWIIWLLLGLLTGSTQALARQDRPILHLLVLQPDARPVIPAKAMGVDDAEVPALTTAAGRAMTAAFVGRPIDDTLMADISEQVRNYYVALGRPFVQIAIPAQNVGSGVLRVNVTEMKIGRITVEGNRWYGDQQYVGAISMRSGSPIDTNRLAADTNWINREAHRHAAIEVGPSAEPDTYDLIVRAQDRLPLDVTFIADNAGTSETGIYDLGLEVDWSNAFWRGDTLSYALLTTPDSFFRPAGHALSYTTYLPWRDSVTIAGSIVDIRAKPIAGLDAGSENAHGAEASFRYRMTLPGTSDFSHHIDLGFEFKSTNVDVLSAGILVFPSTSELDQFVVSYGLRRSDKLGLTDFTVTLTESPGNLTPRNTQATLATVQPGASPSYFYGRLAVDRLTYLPLGSVWSLKLAAQNSSANLLPSEQLRLGGFQSIRGFAEVGAWRDDAAVMQNELRLAPVRPLFWRDSTDADTLVPFVFADVGAGRNHADIAGATRSWVEVVSAGPGLDWQVTPAAALRLSWGFPLLRNGHTGPLLGPQFGMVMRF